MKKTAFTLIELLVVIVIIGILASISIATFSSMKEKARLAKILSFSEGAHRHLLATIVEEEKNPIAFFDLDEGSGVTINDTSTSSFNLNAGTVNWSSDTPKEQSEYSISSPGVASAPINGFGQSDTVEELTISLWVKHGSFPSNSYLTYAFSRWGINTNGGDLRFYINGTNDLNDFLPETNDVLQTDTWHHVLATYNGSIKRLYLDGELLATESVSAANRNGFETNQHTGNIHIGIGSGIDALIDEVRFYPVFYDGN